jgi:ATP-binding cassette subfamily F protein 3
VRQVRGDFTVEAARQYLARFRFWGDDPLRVVSGFSGGERSRLALARLLLEPRNLLFLDEPTNHLDIPAAEILEEALVGFEGTVLFVSHDRRFLENVATRIVSVRDGVVDIYQGGFRDYIADHAPKPVEKTFKKERVESKIPDKLDAKRDYEQKREQARNVEKKKKRVSELEKMIANGEQQIGALRSKLREAPEGDWEKLAKMAQEEQALAKRVDSMMAEWTQLSAEIE